MRHPVSVPTISRTVVVGAYCVALALAGDPVWLAVILGVSLVLVWLAPLVLVPPRRRPATPGGEPTEAGPS
ncbi:MAG: hypothetical protein ABWY29_02580 [Blastococcus sp.]